MFPQLGPAIAIALASATFLVANLALGNTEAFLQYGWRIPFLISIVLVAAGLYVRLKIEETPVFRASEQQQPAHTPLREAFTQAPREVLLAAGAAMALAVVVSAISSDRFGRRFLIMAACAGAVAWSLVPFPLLDTHSPVAFAVTLIVTLGLQGLGYGPAGAFLPETFPTRYRYTGAGASYNLAGILGGAMPPLVAALLAATFGSFAVGILLCALSLLSLLCTKALVETKDRDLRQAQRPRRPIVDPHWVSGAARVVPGDEPTWAIEAKPDGDGHAPSR